MSGLTRPIIGIENRTAQEVLDIMRDRFTRENASSQAEIERLRTLLTDARAYLGGTNPLMSSGGVRNMDLRNRIDAVLIGSKD